MNTTDYSNSKKAEDMFAHYLDMSFLQDSKDEIEQVCQMIGLNPSPTSVSDLIAGMLRYNRALFARFGGPRASKKSDAGERCGRAPVGAVRLADLLSHFLDIHIVTLEFSIKAAEIQRFSASRSHRHDGLKRHVSEAGRLLTDYFDMHCRVVI